jgi:hypothetical protein
LGRRVGGESKETTVEVKRASRRVSRPGTSCCDRSEPAALLEFVENQLRRLGLPPVAYEVGTEEVHGGLVDYSNFHDFITGLRAGLETKGFSHAWPCFIVGKVAPLGSLVKGHYTD